MYTGTRAYKLPVLALAYQQMQAAGVELHDFFLIRNDSTLSMRAHGGL